MASSRTASVSPPTPKSRASDKSAAINELEKANSKGQGILGPFPESVSSHQFAISHRLSASDEVPKSVMKLLLYAQDTFGISKDVFDTMLANALFTCSPGVSFDIVWEIPRC